MSTFRYCYDTEHYANVKRMVVLRPSKKQAHYPIKDEYVRFIH